MKNLLIASIVAASAVVAPSVARADDTAATLQTPPALDGMSARSSFRLAGILSGIGLAGFGAAIPIALVAKGSEPATFVAVGAGSVGGLLLVASIPVWIHGARALQAEKAARSVTVTPTRGGATVSVTLTF